MRTLKEKKYTQPCRTWGSRPWACPGPGAYKPRETFGLRVAVSHPEKGHRALEMPPQLVPLGFSPVVRIIPPRHKRAPPTETS